MVKFADLPDGYYKIIGPLEGRILTIQEIFIEGNEQKEGSEMEAIMNPINLPDLEEEMEGIGEGKCFCVLGPCVLKVLNFEAKINKEILAELLRLNKEMKELRTKDYFRNTEIQEEIIFLKGQIKALSFVLSLKFSHEDYPAF